MNEERRKAIMKRSRLRNVYLNSKKTSDGHAYRKQFIYLIGNKESRLMTFLVIMLTLFLVFLNVQY